MFYFPNGRDGAAIRYTPRLKPNGILIPCKHIIHLWLLKVKDFETIDAYLLTLHIMN